jgi:chromosomal replication initiation ATPase DnaA
MKTTIDSQVEYLSKFFNLTPEQIKKKTRKREICLPRQMIATYLSDNRFTYSSQKDIAFSLGHLNCNGRGDHSTIANSRKTVSNLISTSKKFTDEWDNFNNYANSFHQKKELEFLPEKI